MIVALAEHFALAPAWPLLGALPLLWLGLLAQARRQRRVTGAALGARAGNLTAELDWRRRRAGRALFLLGFLGALVAALQPLWGSEVRPLEQRGVDLVVCLDVSRSMLARDVAPSRLLAAKRELRTLAERARGDRLALVAYAGEARLVVPLTQDVATFLEMLEQTDTLAVRRGGTDLGAALQCALAATASARGDHEAIVLITDGEDHEGRGRRQAELCRQRGVAVHCVGFGSPLGSKIAVETGRGEAFVRDKAGNEVVSALDTASLRQISAASGGEFVDANASAQPLVELYDRRIVPMARKALATAQRSERKNQFQWPLLLAVLAWLAELVLAVRAGAGVTTDNHGARSGRR